MLVTKYKKFDYLGFSLEKLDYMDEFDFDINFVVGGRSNHKTSTIQCRAIDNWMNKREKSSRLLRYKDDAKAMYIKDFFQPYVIKYVWDKYHAYLEYYRGEYCLCWYENEDDKKPYKREAFMKIHNLMSVGKYKSSQLEDISLILFDEFAPLQIVSFLPGEVGLFDDYISSVNRSRKSGLKVYLVGNMISVDNMYFEYYDIDAYELTATNIYDYTVEGYRRVGLYCVESVNESVEDAPRILRNPKGNNHATKQDKYDIPDTIIGINDIFLYLLVYDKEYFYKRFKIRTVIDVMDLDQHDCYLIIYQDKYNDRIAYCCTTKKDKSDLYCVLPDNILYEKSQYTITNSIRKLPVFRGFENLNEFRYLDRVARQTVKNLIENRRILN